MLVLERKLGHLLARLAHPAHDRHHGDRETDAREREVDHDPDEHERRAGRHDHRQVGGVGKVDLLAAGRDAIVARLPVGHQ